MDTYKTQAQVDALTEAAFQAAKGHGPCISCGAIIDEYLPRLPSQKWPQCYPCREGNRRVPLYRSA